MIKKQIALNRTKKKPAFVAQDSWKVKSLPKSWRRPRGMHSKMRQKMKGNPKTPSQGYRAPREIRGLHPSGFKPPVVSSINQLSGAKEGIIISAAVGVKKKLAIIKAAKEKKLAIFNVNADEFARKAESELSERKKKRHAAEAAKAEKRKEPEKKEESKKEETEEEKRRAAKIEMEKIITQPEK